MDEELRARAVVSDAVVLFRTTETALPIMTWQDVVQFVSITKAIMDDLESWYHHAKPGGTASLPKGCHSTGDVVAVHKSQSCASALKEMLTHVLCAFIWSQKGLAQDCNSLAAGHQKSVRRTKKLPLWSKAFACRLAECTSTHIACDIQCVSHQGKMTLA